MRHDLTSGAWIEYRPTAELKRKHKVMLHKMSNAKISKGIPADQIAAILGEDGDRVDTRSLIASVAGSMNLMDFGEGTQEAVWAMVITAWSYDLPVPSMVINEDGTPSVADVASFGELPLDDSNEIEKLLAAHQAKLSRRPDPKGTTTSSSSGSSRVSAGPPSLMA